MDKLNLDDATWGELELRKTRRRLLSGIQNQQTRGTRLDKLNLEIATWGELEFRKTRRKLLSGT